MSTLFDMDEVPVTSGDDALWMSMSNEWYTPAIYVNAARKLMNGIDLDPASCELANKTVRAGRYYTKEDDGLTKPWLGKIWLNPPYGYNGPTRQKGNVGAWINRLIEQYELGHATEAVLLVNATTEKRWFDPLWHYPICFVSKRISFYSSDGEYGRPPHANAIIYFGSQERQFVNIFSQFGPIVRAISPDESPVTQPSLFQ